MNVKIIIGIATCINIILILILSVKKLNKEF